jgi:hypothetical protein
MSRDTALPQRLRPFLGTRRIALDLTMLAPVFEWNPGRAESNGSVVA